MYVQYKIASENSTQNKPSQLALSGLRWALLYATLRYKQI